MADAKRRGRRAAGSPTSRRARAWSRSSSSRRGVRDARRARRHARRAPSPLRARRSGTRPTTTAHCRSASGRPSPSHTWSPHDRAAARQRAQPRARHRVPGPATRRPCSPSWPVRCSPSSASPRSSSRRASGSRRSGYANVDVSTGTAAPGWPETRPTTASWSRRRRRRRRRRSSSSSPRAAGCVIPLGDAHRDQMLTVYERRARRVRGRAGDSAVASCRWSATTRGPTPPEDGGRGRRRRRAPRSGTRSSREGGHGRGPRPRAGRLVPCLDAPRGRAARSARLGTQPQRRLRAGARAGRCRGSSMTCSAWCRVGPPAAEVTRCVEVEEAAPTTPCRVPDKVGGDERPGDICVTGCAPQAVARDRRRRAPRPRGAAVRAQGRREPGRARLHRARPAARRPGRRHRPERPAAARAPPARGRAGGDRRLPARHRQRHQPSRPRHRRGADRAARPRAPRHAAGGDRRGHVRHRQSRGGVRRAGQRARRGGDPRRQVGRAPQPRARDRPGHRRHPRPRQHAPHALVPRRGRACEDDHAADGDRHGRST